MTPTMSMKVVEVVSGGIKTATKLIAPLITHVKFLLFKAQRLPIWTKIIIVVIAVVLSYLLIIAPNSVSKAKANTKPSAPRSAATKAAPANTKADSNAEPTVIASRKGRSSTPTPSKRSRSKSRTRK